MAKQKKQQTQQTENEQRPAFSSWEYGEVAMKQFGEGAVNFVIGFLKFGWFIICFGFSGLGELFNKDKEKIKNNGRTKAQ